MKICFCIGKLTFSGAENVLRFLAEGLIERGFEVSVVLLNSLPGKEEMIHGLTVEEAIVNETGIKSIIKRIRKERKALRKIQPDVFVIFNCEMAFSAIPASLGLKNTKVLVCERNDPKNVPISQKKRRIRDIMYRFAYAGVFQTEEIGAYFESIIRKRYVIPNPVRKKAEKCAPVSQREKTFATVARLDNYQKNQSMMIQGFLEATKGHEEIQLHLLGEGPDRAQFERLLEDFHAQERVKLLGNVSNPIEYLKNCRAFLLTSNFEGMPNALLEAMSIGLPCISTNCGGGGAAFLIDNNINGILIDRNNREQLVAAVKALMQDDDLCQKLGDQAYKVNDSLSGDMILEKWIKVFETV